MHFLTNSAQGWTYFGILLLAIVVLVFIHEMGHFLVAKANKVRVSEFAIGFGPQLFSFKKNGTVYSLRLLPFGGFVSVLSKQTITEIERLKVISLTEKQLRFLNKKLHGLTLYEDYSWQKPIEDIKWYKKLWFSLAGITFNFISAILILTLTYTFIGQPKPNGDFIYSWGSYYFMVDQVTYQDKGGNEVVAVSYEDVSKLLMNPETYIIDEKVEYPVSYVATPTNTETITYWNDSGKPVYSTVHPYYTTATKATSNIVFEELTTYSLIFDVTLDFDYTGVANPILIGDIKVTYTPELHYETFNLNSDSSDGSEIYLSAVNFTQAVVIGNTPVFSGLVPVESKWVVEQESASLISIGNALIPNITTISNGDFYYNVPGQYDETYRNEFIFYNNLEVESMGSSFLDATKDSWDYFTLSWVWFANIMSFGALNDEIYDAPQQVVYDVDPNYWLYYILNLIVIFSMLMVVFNILPIPPLDGWHASEAIYEGFTGKTLGAKTQSKLNKIGWFFIMYIFIISFFTI